MTNQYGIPQGKWEKILGLLTQHPEIESVVLFGSRAKGNFRDASDIDLCLKGDFKSQLIPKILNQYEELYFPWKLDLISWEAIDNQDLADHINRVGIEVHPANSNS